MNLSPLQEKRGCEKISGGWCASEFRGTKEYASKLKGKIKFISLLINEMGLNDKNQMMLMSDLNAGWQSLKTK